MPPAQSLLLSLYAARLASALGTEGAATASLGFTINFGFGLNAAGSAPAAAITVECSAVGAEGFAVGPEAASRPSLL
jgi:hypothetical protein